MAAIATIEGPTLTPEEEQEKWLGEAQRVVKEKAMYIRAAMKTSDSLKVLQFTSQMLSELRTGLLTPQNYYELYQRVFDEMQQVEMYFLDEVTQGRQKVDQLYATAQHAGNIVPRLMLLITIGSVFIKTKTAPAKDILMDLIEMSKGVQHPTRGLFVRHYLSTLMKNKLPDVDNEYDGAGGSVMDSASFIVRNFKEMVWLWYRMETKSQIKNKPQRDRERRELRVLVGFNLVRLSQLDGIDKAMYADRVLPIVLQIILDHKEPMQQQYLFEVIIQVFPDEFHLATLPPLLDALSGVCAGVNVQAILTPLMDRLGNYVVSLRDGTVEGGGKKEEKVIKHMFAIFQQKISELAAQLNSSSFSPTAIAETLGGLMKMSLRAYPEHYERIDETLGVIYAHFMQVGSVDEGAQKAVRKALEHVAKEVKDPNIILDFANFVGVLSLLNFNVRRSVAISFVASSGKRGKKIDTLERVGKLFDILAPIVKTLDDTPADKREIYTIDPASEFTEEQQAVCKALHLIDADDLPLLMKVYSGVRKQLGQGGEERMRYTLKAMTQMYVRLALRCKKLEVAGTDPGVNTLKIFTYLHTGDGKGILEFLATHIPVETFFLYLSAANAADTCELHDTTYNLYAAAFQLYEENAAVAKTQMHMLNSLIASTAALRSVPEESYDIIATKLCQYSSKVVQKADQSKMVALCSHLFWKKALAAETQKKAHECLQRSLKIADACPAGHQFGLFASALNEYCYYYSAKMPQVSVKSVQALLDMNAEAVTSDDADKTSEAFKAAKTFYRNTQKLILARQKEGDERWTEFVVGATV